MSRKVVLAVAVGAVAFGLTLDESVTSNSEERAYDPQGDVTAEVSLSQRGREGLSGETSSQVWICGKVPTEEESKMIAKGEEDIDFGSVMADGFEVSVSPLPMSPWPEALVFHSLPGSENFIYLDFDGEVVSGTVWNNQPNTRPDFTAKGYSLPSTVTFGGRDENGASISQTGDGIAGTLGVAEQIAIRNMWQRSAEAFSPFNVDVTTERPSAADFAANRVIHLVFTEGTTVEGDGSPYADQAPGVAIGAIGNPNFGTYNSPSAFVYCDLLGYQPRRTGQVGVHEVGHNFGLMHDGEGGAEYYGGYGGGGSNPVSWAPIMGQVNFPKSLFHWSNGSYSGANNTQDDVAIIAGLVGVREDDHADTDAGASPLLLKQGSVFDFVSFNQDSRSIHPVSSHPGNRGVIQADGDVDTFTFFTGGGALSLHVWPWRSDYQSRGGSLDVLIELTNDQGNVIATANPVDETDAEISMTLGQGRYFLRVTNTGVGSPPFNSGNPGYSSYGSLGPYFIEGTIVPSGLTGYAGWVEEYYLQPGQALVGDDGDGDQVTNIFEFAFGMRPNRNDAGLLPWGASASGGVVGAPRANFSILGNAVRFPRRLDHGLPGSVSYHWRFSADLLGWESSSDAPSWLVAPVSLGPDPSGNYEIMEVPFPSVLESGDTPSFFQMEITNVPEPGP